MSSQDLAILENALQGEYFGIAAYEAALSLGVLGEAAAGAARAFQSDHREHANAIAKQIEALGATPAPSKTWEEYAAQDPPPALDSEANVLRYAASLELGAAAADARAVAELESPELRTMFVRIASVESMHLATLRQALGDAPVPAPLLPM